MKTAKAIPTGGVRTAPLDRNVADPLAMGLEPPIGSLRGVADTPLRQMEWAPPHPGSTQKCAVPDPHEDAHYGPLEWARAWAGRLGAETFVLQDDGMLLCPQGVELWLSETRQENASTQRLVFVAKDADCAPCPVRAACLGRTASGKRGRRVSAVRHRRITGVVLHPRPVGVRSGHPVERCGWTPAAALVDGPLAAANGDGGCLACELVSTGPSSSCGTLPPAPELAGAPGTQCPRSSPGVTSIQVSGVTQQVLDLLQPHA